MTTQLQFITIIIIIIIIIIIYKCISFFTLNTPQLISIKKANRLILLKETLAVNRKNHKKHVTLNKICGQRTRFINVIAGEA